MPTVADKRQDLTRQAVAAFQSGDTATADRLFRKLATDKKADAQSQYNYGVFLRRSGRPADALYWFDRCLRVEPSRADAQIERGLTQADLGHVEAAIRDLSAHPDDPDALRALPPLLMQTGRWAAALTAIDRLRSHTVQDALLRLRVLLELGRIAEAEALSDGLARAHPDLRPDLLKTLVRRAKGQLSLDESRQAGRLGG